MSYRYVYPNGGASVGAVPNGGYNMDHTLMSAGYANGAPASMYDNRRRQSYSPGSFSSDSESSDGYEYRGRMITRETRCPRDVVRAPTPPPIIKRVVERAPTPEAPVMERVIIRPQAQEIVERVIEQPRTPPPRIIEKEMHEEAPPPIVRTRVIKVDRPLRSGYSQPGSPYCNPCNGLPSFSNGMMPGGPNDYRTQSIIGSVGRPTAYHNVQNDSPSFSSASSFEYMPPGSMAPVASGQPMMMMMPQSHQPQPIGAMQQSSQPMTFMQQAPQSMGLMQQGSQPMSVMQQPQPGQQQYMYRQMQQVAPQSAPQMSSPYMPQNYMFPGHQHGMSFGYRPMMQQGRMIPSGMPMMAPSNPLGTPSSSFASQPPMFNPLAQQMVY